MSHIHIHIHRGETQDYGVPGMKKGQHKLKQALTSQGFKRHPSNSMGAVGEPGVQSKIFPNQEAGHAALSSAGFAHQGEGRYNHPAGSTAQLTKAEPNGFASPRTQRAQANQHLARVQHSAR